MGRKWSGLQGSSSVVHSCNPRQLICTTPDKMVHTYNLKHGDSYLQFQAWWLKPAIPGMVVHTCNPRHGSSYLQPQAGLYLQSQAWWLISAVPGMVTHTCNPRHGVSYLQSQTWCPIPTIPGMVSHICNPSTWEPKVERIQGHGQHGLQSEIVSHIYSLAYKHGHTTVSSHFLQKWGNQQLYHIKHLPEWILESPQGT